ncbi:CdaR family protein [Anaeromicropila populeti]|uniref:YbbR domain-containing protein n=1 Tax=Anaeromicropila populeti TaxID=37658 RepID=A0A1I6HRX5_9FIRM|nr:CdaR family protein [Anaeromicropila populeti]SFR57221.1 YbbR domain-containing protein [Anaeromicropila populeti]
MKEKLINNLGLKILSLCLAAFIWIVIINIEDPIKTIQFTNVQVTVLNENYIKERGKAYTITSGVSVDFTVEGKRSVLDDLKKTDFVVTADLATLVSPWKAIGIDIECPKHSSEIDIIPGKVRTMGISLEDIVTVKVPVQIETTGTVAEGKATGAASYSPIKIEVTGAESIINKVYEVKVLVDITGATEEIKQKLEPKAYDENGKEISSDKLTFGVSKISVTIPLLDTKTVPIEFSVTGEPETGYAYVENDYDPGEITIKGDAEDLEKIEKIPVSIDISGQYSDVEGTYSLSDVLPDGVSLVSQEEENIVYKIGIVKLSKKQITINMGDVLVKNLPDEYYCEYPNETCTVTIVALSEILADLGEEDIGVKIVPYIDYKDIQEGRQKVQLSLTLPDNVQTENLPVITVVIKKNVEETEGNPDEEPVNTPQATEDLATPSLPTETPNSETSEEPQATEE